MRALFATVAGRSAAIVATLLISGLAVFVWWDDRVAVEEERDQQVALVGAVLSVTTDVDDLRVTLTRSSPDGRLAVHLPRDRRVGPTRAPVGDVRVGLSRASAADVRQALWLNRSGAVDVPDGRSYLHPAATVGGGAAVVEIYQPDTGFDLDVLAVIAVFVVLGLAGAGVALFSAHRLSRPVVRQLRELGAAATSSDVTAAAWSPTGRTVPELATIAVMINRVGALARQLVEREHRMIADVSHRLRTPLTALRLDVEAIAPGPVTERIRSAVVALEHDIGDIIRAAGLPPEPIERAATTSDLADVVRRRMQFWRILADNQGRHCLVDAPDTPARVPLAEDDLADIVNNLVGNVFRHTAPGVPLAVTVGGHGGWVSLVVDDGGPGIADPEAALQRGVSGVDSTGLGLDIVRTRSEAVGGAIHLERGKLGGARVRLRFAEARGHGGGGMPMPR